MDPQRKIIPNTRWAAPDPEQLRETAGPEPRVITVPWRDAIAILAVGGVFAGAMLGLLAIGGGM